MTFDEAMDAALLEWLGLCRDPITDTRKIEPEGALKLPPAP